MRTRRWTPRSDRIQPNAGGLTPENLPALLVHRPFGVDLSSGLESAPGVKDPGRLRDLFALLETAS